MRAILSEKRENGTRIPEPLLLPALPGAGIADTLTFGRSDVM